MNEGDGQIAQRGHGLRSRACAQARTIFAKGDIAQIMQAVLDAPMAPRQIEEASRTGLDGGEVGDEVDHLLSRLARFAHRDRARQARHLTDQRPVGSQIVVHATTDLDRAEVSRVPDADRECNPAQKAQSPCGDRRNRWSDPYPSWVDCL